MPHSRESGQAAVEAALIIPMMVFLVLGTIQLGMMHQSRLLTEYAAFRAVRAGIVNGGDCQTMYNSAVVALLPSFGAPQTGGSGRADTLQSFGALYAQYDPYNAATEANRRYANGLPLVRVEVLNPKRSALPALFSTYGAHLQQRELDYDDVRDSAVIAANLLSVRVTYHYNLRIPFANWLIHGWFMGTALLSQMRGISFESQTIGGSTAHERLEQAGLSKGGTQQRQADLAQIYSLATSQRTFVVPLVSTYTMRMQSNLLRGRVLGCAVDA